jgi:Zn-dependent protease
VHPLAALALLVLAALSVPVVHEVAHVIAAKLVGARVIGVAWREQGRLAPRVEVDMDAGAGGGAVLFFVAGPLANAAVSALGLALFFGAGRSANVLLLLAAGLHGVFAVANLLPVGDRDGANALAALRRR